MDRAIQQISRIFTKLSTIVRAWYYVAIFFDPPYAKERRKICHTAEPQKTKCKMLKLGICTECGCPIISKPRIKSEYCGLGYWKALK